MTDRVSDAVEPEQAAYWWFAGGDETNWATVKADINAGVTYADSASNAFVVKVETGGDYVYPSGTGPVDPASILFIGADDPTTTDGGRDSAYDVWLQL